MERYSKNFGQGFTTHDHKKCLANTVAVIGAGGVGGFLLEHLARLGAKSILVFDGDTFNLSNINRQRFCNVVTVNHEKAVAAANDLRFINPSVPVIPIVEYFSEKHVDTLLQENTTMVFHCADYGDGLDDLNNGISRCLANRIPVIKTGVHADAVSATWLNPRELDMWFNIKKASEEQVAAGKDLQISALSHRCSMAAALAMEAYLRYLRYPSSHSYCLSYNFDTMHTSVEL